MAGSATYFNSRNVAWLAKVESTEGSDSSPAIGTDDIMVMDGGTWSDGTQLTDVRLDWPYGGRVESPVGVKQPTATFTIPLYGVGETTSVVDIPRWMSAILQTGGTTDLTTGSGASLAWYPTMYQPVTIDESSVESDAARTFTLYRYTGLLDGTDANGTKRLQKMVGCRLQSVTFRFAPGEVLTAALTVVGKYTASGDVTTDISGISYDGDPTDFVTANGLTTTLDSQNTCQSALEITIDWGTQHVSGDCDSNGVVATAASDLTITGTINPLAVAQGTKDWADLVDLGSEVLLASSAVDPQGRSTGDGYGISLLGQFQVTGELDRGGPLLRYALALRQSMAAGAPTALSAYTGFTLSIS